MDSYQLGWENGYWTRAAGVHHRITPTERILELMEGAGVATYFYFGQTTDLVFVRFEDRSKAAKLLRGARFPGVEAHTP